MSPGWATSDDITPRLAEHGVYLLAYHIDVDAFWPYVEEPSCRQMAYCMGGQALVGTEKRLENLVSMAPLRLRSLKLEQDALICLASEWGKVQGSFFDPVHFVERLLGSRGRLCLPLYRPESYKKVLADFCRRFSAVLIHASRRAASILMIGPDHDKADYPDPLLQ